MTFKFPCPHCGQRVAATDDLVGQSVVCPTCSENFVVLSPADLPVAAIAADGSGAAPAANRSHPQHWVIIGSVVALAVGGGLFFWSNNKPAPRTPPAASLEQQNFKPSVPDLAGTQPSLIPGLPTSPETVAPPSNTIPGLSEAPSLPAPTRVKAGPEITFPIPESTDAAVQAKLSKIILPRIDFRDTTLSECVKFLNRKSKELDAQSTGVSVVIDPSIPPSTTGLRLTLQLNNLPEMETLNYVAHLCGLRFRIDASGVTLLAKDDTKSFEWIQKAAAQGNPDAQCNLGFSYAAGQGVPIDYSKAVEWFQKAAAQGNAMAQFNLGVAYANGQGSPIDMAKSIEWYQKAAVQGDALAQHELGAMYGTGRGVPKDDTKAVEWFQKAAAQGEAKAQCDLGYMYATGRGVPKDDSKAFKWYQKAAAQGDAAAEYNLGDMYDTGRSVPKNDTKAFEWFQKAAVQGNSEAKEWVRNYMDARQAKPSSK